MTTKLQLSYAVDNLSPRSQPPLLRVMNGPRSLQSTVFRASQPAPPTVTRQAAASAHARSVLNSRQMGDRSKSSNDPRDARPWPISASRAGGVRCNSAARCKRSGVDVRSRTLLSVVVLLVLASDLDWRDGSDVINRPNYVFGDLESTTEAPSALASRMIQRLQADRGRRIITSTCSNPPLRRVHRLRDARIY